MDEGDRISSLADEILLHILSSLPFESAIQTLTLSKRWTLLWNTPRLHHGPSHRAADSVFSFISSVNPTRKLCFHFTDANGSILSAVIAPNSKLHLHFSSPPAIAQLFHLQLHINPQFKPCFIKSLHLKGVTSLANEAASSIFTKLHSLETLKISDCNCLQSLSVDSETKLHSLTIFDCPQLEYVHIRCFKLKTFQYRGIMPSIWPEYHYNLDDAFLDFRLGRINNASCNFDLVLLTIKNVRVLTLCKWTFQELICGALSGFHAEFQLYKVKQVWWIDNQYDGDALFSFLKLCPSLESLFVTIEPESYRVEKASSWKCIEGGRNTKLRNLEVVKLKGFTNQKDEIDLAERLGEIVTTQPLIFNDEDGKDLSGIMHPHMRLSIFSSNLT